MKFFMPYFFTLYFFEICAKIKNDRLVAGVKIFDFNSARTASQPRIEGGVKIFDFISWGLLRSLGLKGVKIPDL